MRQLVLFALLAGAVDASTAAADDEFTRILILSWNVHWQCGSDYIKGCRANATERFIQLQQETRADVVLAVELEATDTQPVDLVAAGMGDHWKQVSAGCAAVGTGSGDAIALLLDTAQYKVEASSGGCLGGKAGGPYKADARAFAVALVTPLQKKVAGCKKLCMVGVHSPHVAITNGSDTVAAVCGDVKDTCTVAVGDWNAPVSHQPFCNYTVADRWSQLVGGPASALYGVPDQLTCCYPNTKYNGWDDHVVTNIAGTSHSMAETFPYQMSAFSNDTEEHHPIFVDLLLKAP